MKTRPVDHFAKTGAPSPVKQSEKRPVEGPSHPWLGLGVLLAVIGSALGQPVITQEPQSSTNLAGSTATFTVMATGASPVAYQWQKNAFDLAGYANGTLVITNVQAADTADYAVVVSNIEGAVTSTVAHLFIVVPPKITYQPTDLAVALGTSVARFTVSVVGTTPFGYQWRLEGVDLPGATYRTLELRSVQFTNAGGYTVVVTNRAGAVTSRIVQLSVAAGGYFTDARGTNLPYRLFLPPKYDPGAKYPLVVFWHGTGEDGMDNLAQLKDNGQFSFLTTSNLAKNPCFYLLPQVPSFPFSPAEAYGFLDCATNLLSQLETQFSIDSDRVYLTGLSMGGFFTWAMVARYPELWAAAVPLSGGWYYNSFKDFARSLRVPIWNFHAADDDTVPVGMSDSAVSSLRGTGASILYTRYQNGGHPIWPTAYSTPPLLDWLMAQRRGVAPTNEPLLSITSPTNDAVFWTGATNLNLAGTAAALGQAITEVTWNDTTNSRTGTAIGSNTWSVAGIPLLLNHINPVVVLSATTSWAGYGGAGAPGSGGSTTVNRTLTVIQSPLLATLSLQATNALLSWTGGGPPYCVQRATNLAAGDWTDVVPNATPPVMLPLPLATPAAFYRIIGQ
jgi:predicted esterase